MFRVSLLTIVVSFFACVLLVLWVLRREHLREVQRRAEEHLAFAGVLANGIVHDFRNPMSALRLDVQMLHKEAEKGADSRLARVSELAGRVRTTLDRMDKVFQEFLYLSRPAKGSTETFDLADCLRECAAMLAPRFEQKRVRVEFDVEGAAAISGQRAALQRAFINVLTNAEQFSPEDGTVTVRVRGDLSMCVAEFIDRGPGIPADDHKRIFDMFHSTRPGGTGLGLFLAKTAVEGAGGRIEASSHPAGQGACIRIALRAAHPKEERKGS
jgi:two-component system sensor histidine kinase PilS (NtrC family)